MYAVEGTHGCPDTVIPAVSVMSQYPACHGYTAVTVRYSGMTLILSYLGSSHPRLCFGCVADVYARMHARDQYPLFVVEVTHT
jgi:hypothetical protein